MSDPQYAGLIKKLDKITNLKKLDKIKCSPKVLNKAVQMMAKIISQHPAGPGCMGYSQHYYLYGSRGKQYCKNILKNDNRTALGVAFNSLMKQRGLKARLPE